MDSPGFGPENGEQQYLENILTLLDIPSDLVILLDRTGKIDFVNATFLKVSGLAREQVIGHSLTEVLPRRLAEKRIATIQAVARDKVPIRFEDQGVIGWLDNMVYPILDSDGQVERIAVVARDINDRKEMEEQLKESYSTIQALLNAPTDIVLLLDTDGRIVLANQTYADLVHKSPQELIGTRFWDYVPKDTLATRQAYFDQVLRSKHTVRFEDHGIANYLDLVLYPILGKQGEVMRVAIVARNITKLKETEEALLRSQEKLQAAGAELAQRVQKRTDELALANLELRRAMQHAEMLARAASRLNAQTELQDVAETICDEARLISGFACTGLHLCNEESDSLNILAAVGEHKERFLQLKPTPRLVYEGYFDENNPVIIPNLVRLPPAHDAELAAELNICSVVILQLFHGGDLIGALSLYTFGEERLLPEEDLRMLQGLAELGATALAKAIHLHRTVDSRARLQLLSRRLVETQETERRNLGLELHDEVGQMLTSLKMALERIAKAAPNPPFPGAAQMLEEIDIAGQQVRTILDQVRNLSLDLRPPMLDELGLLPALIATIDRLSERNGLRVNFRHSGLYQRLPGVVENTIYRMVQEGLTNVIRHAGVNEASVLLLKDGDLLVTQVRDNGIGFDPSQLTDDWVSNGLPGMRERIELCGGQLTIETRRGQGTCLTAEIPLGEFQALFSENQGK